MALEGWIVDTTVAKRVGGVPIGGTWVPTKFTVHADHLSLSGRWVHVNLTCSTETGKTIDVEGLSISGEPGLRITTRLLRQIPVPRLAHLGMWSSAVRRDEVGLWQRVIPESQRQRLTDVTPWSHNGPDEEVPRTTVVADELNEEWLAQLEVEFRKLSAAKQGPRVRNDAWYRKLESAYLDAIEKEEPTGEAVATTMHLSVQSAKNAIGRARELGYNLPKRARVK